jgi:hypothetical protein
VICQVGQNPKLKKYAVFCTVLRKIVHLRDNARARVSARELQILSAGMFKGVGHLKHAVFSKRWPVDLQANGKAG